MKGPVLNPFWFSVIVVNSLLLTKQIHAGNANTGKIYLDAHEKYLLEWKLDSIAEIVYFNVTAETNGFVGFGLSPNEGMSGADILIAGLTPEGITYSGDYHANNNARPIQDQNSDWVVTSARETGLYTNIAFHRKLNTCDTEDLKITDATIRIIWAMGDTDDISYHNANRGTKSVNLFLQPENDFQPENYEKLDLAVNITMAPQHTTYWCTIHKAPVFSKRQHIIAFNALLESHLAREHTHHFILYKCTVPETYTGDKSKFFERWADHEGDYCYNPKDRLFPFLHYCIINQVYGWAKGGEGLVFPPNMGLAMQEEPNVAEYFALEIHLDNPQLLSTVQFTTGASIYYTADLRETEVGLLRVDHDIWDGIQLTIPPKVKDYVVAGHCSGECTQKYLPEEGITIFNNGLHSHLAGRKLKLRHFRGNQELSWIDDEPYYDFNYQQYKMLSSRIKLLKGDQLTVECTYDSMDRNGKAIIGGLSTHEEMCISFVYYYPKIPFWYCGSSQDKQAHMKLLGIEKDRYNPFAMLPGGLPAFRITEPESLAGDYVHSVSYKVNWTDEFLRRYQHEKRYGDQNFMCRDVTGELRGNVSYPKEFIEYVPTDECTPMGLSGARQTCSEIMKVLFLLSIVAVVIT